MERRGQTTQKIITKIMEYTRFKKKLTCSKTIHQRFSTSWLSLAHPDLVRCSFVYLKIEIVKGK